MRIWKISVILIVLALLISCAQMKPHPMDMTQAIQNAKTTADHEALARHYEATAREMQSKAQEHKRMLEQYEAHREFYGRRGLDMESMCHALINFYEQAVKENMDMANSHRKVAAEIK
ncbi:hypothetical protein [Nitrosomonas sp. Is37]|uniref:hypothetical protein n=1 Tax=Nitrosomonas sp. Is37 TaxID=3080535 RepID=UPI00294B333A|nr:hypothetical protein [Nitrosomonas sp. Is37]MDV6344697.1 hypothetical protein [Nitrosomonas sp. Is37]